MRRVESFLALVVAAMAVFVGVQVARRPKHKPPAPSVVETAETDVAPAPIARPIQSVPALADVSTTVTDRSDSVPAVPSLTVAPARDVAAILAQIASTPGTYMQQMLADVNGELLRWQNRQQDGLRVWVQRSSAVRDWDMRYTQMARDAVADWSDGLPIRFDFVLDSASSEVQIVWIDHFAPEFGRRVGSTRLRHDRNGWLVDAQIQVALHDSSGTAIPPQDLAGIVRHEAGHALGMGHSTDPRTNMYPEETTNVITPADRATLRLLYQLPPGSLR